MSSNTPQAIPPFRQVRLPTASIQQIFGAGDETSGVVATPGNFFEKHKLWTGIIVIVLVILAIIGFTEKERLLRNGRLITGCGGLLVLYVFWKVNPITALSALPGEIKTALTRQK